MTEKEKSKDWNLCCLCQSVTSEKLVDPLACKRPASGIYTSGYKTLAENLLLLQGIEALPSGIYLTYLFEVHQCIHHISCLPLFIIAGIVLGIGLEDLDEETLRKKYAKWHKSCHNQCSRMRYERALRKRKSTEGENGSGKVQTRSKVVCVESKSVCFLCEQDDGTLHRAETMKINNRVKAIATELQDRK